MLPKSFLTRERSPNHTLFIASGLGLVVFAACHLWQGNYGVASFLGIFGLLSIAGGAVLSERGVNALATAFVLVNLVAAVAALAFGFRTQ